mgnify:CR=1 FL=1
MQTFNNKTFNCVGINNTISILRSNRFQIVKVLIIKNSKADKDRGLNSALNLINRDLVQKVSDKKLLSNFKTQGVSITFSGDLISDEFSDFEKNEDLCLLVLDRVEDPQNFGQIIRTAECAGIDGIIYSRHHSAPLNETVLQVSQGAFVNMKFYEVTNIRNELNKLKKNNFWIVGLENSIDAKPWYSIEYSDRTAIVVGSEGRGIRKKVLETCDFIATIPMQGITNSLNVGAATSAIVFESLRQKLEKK